MKKATARITTTHVDRHNERMALSALEGMIEQIESTYIPMGIEHDPRIAPLGRVVAAKITALDDGEHALDAEIELFEDGDVVPLSEGSRRAKIRYCESDRVCVTDDRSFRHDDDQSLIAEIAQLLDAERQTEGKKALEPIAVLTIALKLIGAGALAGFGKKLGEDVWAAMRTKMKALFARKRNTSAQLLNFAVTVDIQGEPRLVEVVLTDPSDADIDACSRRLLQEAVSLVTAEIDRKPFLLRFLFEYSAAEGLTLKFAVAANGVPVGFASKIPSTASSNGDALRPMPNTALVCLAKF